MPTVILDPDSCEFELIGQCYMEHTDLFFQPIFEWLDEFLLINHELVSLNIKLSYFNTSAVKCIWEFLNRLAKYHKRSGQEVAINWYFDEEDDNMHDIYLDFEEEIPLKFNHIQSDEG
ncbi:MAG: DUF1987 domain-containing protein [Flammeovirgaceae bacterium]